MRNYLFFVFFIFSGSIFAQTADQPSGSGSSGDPYQIATLNNLYWITQDSTRWDKVYTQTADIDASTSSSWDGGAGFSPIGDETTKFTGSYDGQGLKITHLFIDRSIKDNIGLFGYTSGSMIANVELENVNITGKDNVGSLIGYQSNSSIVTNCSSAGSVTGSGQFVGGLIGAQQNTSIAKNCCSTDSVMGAGYVGGLIGYQYNASIDSACYSTGAVTGTGQFTGGLIGYQDTSTIANCYSGSSVTGNQYVGGLIGYQNGSTTTNCYSVGLVTGVSSVRGLIGYQTSCTITNCFWDMWTSGQRGSAGGTGKITAELKDYLTFSARGWPMKGVGNGAIWNIGHGRNNGYPYLDWQYPTDAAIAEPSVQPSGAGTSGDPYQIATFSHLNWITQDDSRWDKVYKQTANIDATVSSSLDGGAGFSPIGDITTYFTGSYDGQGYKITHLFINRSTMDFIGLFGKISGDTIKNVTLDSVNISGRSLVGGLIGAQENTSAVIKCSSSGSITGSDQYIGGLIGIQENYSATMNCSSNGSVKGNGYDGGLIGAQLANSSAMNCCSNGSLTGTGYDGGLIGAQQAYSTATNCFSTDSVKGGFYVGGLIGQQGSSTATNCYSVGSVAGSAGGLIGVQTSCTITNCFWDTISSGQKNSAGGIGKSTAEMKNYLTFTGWSFKGIEGGTIWNIGHGRNNGYPYLDWQYPGDSSVVTDVHANSTELMPREFSLNQNFPNPFNPSTTIHYRLPEQSSVRLVIYNILGQVVKELINTEQPAGYQSVVWNATGSSGMYFYRIEATSVKDPNKRFVETKKMLLLK